MLPRISSNVSVYPLEPHADPMADWYASIDKLKQQVPDDVLVLPAHNDCFHGLHARLDRLRRSQDRSLDRLRRRSANRVAPSMYSARCLRATSAKRICRA